MKRFLMTTAVALVPLYAVAQTETADDTVMPTDDPAATEQAETTAPAADAADPAADTEVAEGDDAAEPMAETDDPAMADADPEAEADDPAMAEGAEPMAETDDPAMADAADPMAETDEPEMADADPMGANGLGIQGMVPVSAITGGVVYTTTVEGDDANWADTASYEAVGEGWERIGSIQDVVLSSEGKLEGIVAEVGGFLGIGDKFVLLPLSDMKLVPIDEDSYAVVTPFTSDQLTDMEVYDSSM